MSKSRIPSGFSALFLLALMAPVAFAQGSERVVKATGYLSVDGVKPGSHFKVAVKVQIADGYHVNAHVPSLQELRPTVLSFEPSSGVQFSEPHYPEPVSKQFEFSPDTPLAVLEGDIVIVADATADATIKPGDGTLIAKLNVQACNDSACLLPGEVPVAI